MTNGVPGVLVTFTGGAGSWADPQDVTFQVGSAATAATITCAGAGVPAFKFVLNTM